MAAVQSGGLWGFKYMIWSALAPDPYPSHPGGFSMRSPTTGAACTWWKGATSAASPTGRPTARASSPSAGWPTSSNCPPTHLPTEAWLRPGAAPPRRGPVPSADPGTVGNKHPKSQALSDFSALCDQGTVLG